MPGGRPSQVGKTIRGKSVKSDSKPIKREKEAPVEYDQAVIRQAAEAVRRGTVPTFLRDLPSSQK